MNNVQEILTETQESVIENFAADLDKLSTMAPESWYDTSNEFKILAEAEDNKVYMEAVKQDATLSAAYERFFAAANAKEKYDQRVPLKEYPDFDRNPVFSLMASIISANVKGADIFKSPQAYFGIEDDDLSSESFELEEEVFRDEVQVI